MNPYLNRLKAKKGLPPIDPNALEKPSEPYEPMRGRHFSESDTPFEPYEPDRGSPFLEIDDVSDLVREFMEVDGLSLEEAKTLAAVSVQPRPAGEWLALIAELDDLIARYCSAAKLTGDDRTRMMAARHSQSLASIPETLAWFKRALKAR